MTTRTITAFDLDRTLIYSAASAGDPAVLPPLRVVELYQGAPLCSMTVGAWRLLAELMEHAEVVPVTTRTQAQYERVVLPATPRYALCANGGGLLVDGVRDPEWDGWTRGTAARSAPLAEVLALLEQVADQPWVTKVRCAEDLFCYLVLTRQQDVPSAWLDGFTTTVTALGWSVSLQGRKLYAVPAGVSKASGLARLRDRVAADLAGGGGTGAVRLLATGDSLLDAPMLEVADAAVRPAHGELHEQGWTAAGVEVTTASGALAGEEIVAWMLARTRATPPVAAVSSSARR